MLRHRDLTPRRRAGPASDLAAVGHVVSTSLPVAGGHASASAKRDLGNRSTTIQRSAAALAPIRLGSHRPGEGTGAARAVAARDRAACATSSRRPCGPPARPAIAVRRSSRSRPAPWDKGTKRPRAERFEDVAMLRRGDGRPAVQESALRGRVRAGPTTEGASARTRWAAGAEPPGPASGFSRRRRWRHASSGRAGPRTVPVSAPPSRRSAATAEESHGAAWGRTDTPPLPDQRPSSEGRTARGGPLASCRRSPGRGTVGAEPAGGETR